jgi:hypothetical protein
MHNAWIHGYPTQKREQMDQDRAAPSYDGSEKTGTATTARMVRSTRETTYDIAQQDAAPSMSNAVRTARAYTVRAENVREQKKMQNKGPWRPPLYTVH